MWKPSKNIENLSGKIFLKIELVEMWEIENWLGEILLYPIRENLDIFKVQRIFGDFVFGQGKKKFS